MTAPTTNPNPATQPDISQAKRQRFGQVLSHYRERYHLSIQQLADLLEKPKSTVRFWLRGKRMPHRKELMILCARLNIDMEAFFGKEFVAEQFFQRHLIGLHAMQYRYLQVSVSSVLVRNASSMPSTVMVTPANGGLVKAPLSGPGTLSEAKT